MNTREPKQDRDQVARSPTLALGQVLAVVDSLDDLYQQTLDIIQRDLEVEHVALLIARGSDLVTVAARGQPAAMAPTLRVHIPGDAADQLATSTQAITPDPDAAPWTSSLSEAFPPPLTIQPLPLAKRLVGLLILGREPMQPHEQEQLAILSTQLAGAIDRERYFREGLRHVTELNTVNEISQLLSATLNQETLLPLLHQQVGRVLDASNFYIALYDPVTGQVRFPFCQDAGQLRSEPPRPLAADERASKTEYVLHTGEPFLGQWDIADLLSIRELQSSPHSPRSFLGVPLLLEDQVLGMIGVQDYERENAYDENDLNLLATVAARTAAALENARLFQGRERRIAELSTLNEMARALSSALELPDLLETVYLQVGRLFDTTNFYIATYGEGSKAWTSAFHVEHDQRQPRTQHDAEAGVTGYILRTRQPLLFRTTREGVLFEESQGIQSLGEQSRSWMGVPLIATDKAVGVMAIQSYEQEYLYDEQDLALFSTIGSQAAIAIENLRLLEETRRRARQLETITEIGQAVSATPDLNELLETVYQQISRLFDTTNFYIATYEEGSTEWVTAIELDQGQRQPPARYDISVGATGHIIRTRQQIFLQTYQECVDYDKKWDIAALGEQARSWMSVPLVAADKVVGVMTIQSYEQEYLYDKQDLALFSTVADQVAVAFERLRLLEETRQRAEETRHRAQELEAVNEVSRAITSVLDLDALLHQIVDITKARFDLYYVSIMLLEEEDQIVFRAGSTIGDSDVRLSSGYVALDLHGPGLNPEAARTGQPVLVNDVLRDPRYFELAELADTRSELDVPIQVKGRVIGVLDVQSDQPDAFDQDDVVIIQSLASQAGVAIENARLFERQKRRITEQAILNEMSRAISSALELDALLTTVHQQISRIFDAANFYISLYYKDTDEWDSPLHLEHGQPQPNVRRKVGIGLTGHMIRTRQPVLFRSAEENIAFEESQGIKTIGERAKSWMGVPLVAADAVVGVMAIQNYEQEHLYDEQDLALFSTIAAQVAVAIDNAWLFTEAQRLAVTVKELSAPVIQVWDRVLALPLVGGIDEARSQRIMETLLHGITRHQAQVVIIDVTGVPVIDSWVADHLLNTARATELLGARCVLTGISPEIAQSIVGLNLPLAELVTLPDLQAGIRYALTLLRPSR